MLSALETTQAMLVVMRSDATIRDAQRVAAAIERRGLTAKVTPGQERSTVGVIGNGPLTELARAVTALPGVERVVPITRPYKLASREFCPPSTVIDLGNVRIGGPEFVVIAGPCAVESREQVLLTARRVAAAGATVLRGGAFKPRTSPYAFQGLGHKGLRLLEEGRRECGLPIVTEVMEPGQVAAVARTADILQIGARNMQNFPLVKEVGLAKQPVLLKRGLSATIEEWLMAAEYIMNEGNDEVMLCERGIRTFEPATRNTLDLSAIPLVKQLTHLPIIADPSHGTGHRNLVEPMALAAAAAGADGLIVEVHPDPDAALSDGAQSLSLDGFSHLMRSLKPILAAIGRPLAVCSADRALLASA